MSRSNPQIQNPSNRFLEWSGQKGELHYYDKEKQENITVTLPFEFLVLDELASITGFSPTVKKGFYSNEVPGRAKSSVFTVKLQGQTVYRGTYKNDQGSVQTPKGSKFTKIIYLAYKDGADWHIGRLAAPVGSALTAWIDFTTAHNPENGKTILTKGDKLTAPTGDYYPPKFEYMSSEPDEDKMAINLDKVLQDYLKQYFVTSPDQEEDEHTDEPMTDSFNTNDGKATPQQVADFERRKADKAAKKQLEASDFPDDNAEAQSLYNSIAGNEDVLFDDGDLPPEFRG